MFLQIVFLVFIFISIINIVHFCMYIVGGNIFDIINIKNASKGHKRTYGPRPLVSILIPAHNEEKAIVRCLEFIRKSTYRKFEIIVVDDKSTDDTRKLVRRYIEEHPRLSIKLMYKQKNVGKAMALNHVLKRGVNGSLVMTFDADTVIHRRSLNNAVKYFDDPKVVGVAANVRILDDLSVLGLLQKFEYIVGYRSKKFYSLTNCEFIVGGVASTYRLSTLKKVRYYDNDTLTEDIGLSLKIVSGGNKDGRIVYGSDVLAMTEGVSSMKALMRQRYRWKMGCLQNLLKYRKLFANSDKSYSRILTWYRIPMAFLGEIMLLMEPLAIGFIVYITIKAGSPEFVIGAYLTITLYLLWNVWPDEHMSNSRKLKLSLFSPLMYFIFFIMNLVQLSAIMRCLFQYNQVLRKKNVDFDLDIPRQEWQSPDTI